jgi:hypothetical protein
MRKKVVTNMFMSILLAFVKDAPVRVSRNKRLYIKSMHREIGFTSSFALFFLTEQVLGL